MKTILLLAAIVTLSAGQATAGTKVRPAYNSARACTAVLKHTCVINRRCEWRIAHPPCGQCYQYQVMVTTTRAYYSDGSTRTSTRTTAV